MTPLEAAILGVVQGLTEFLPVSSSAHLVMAEALLGVRQPGVLFETLVHVATLGAVLWVYRGRLEELARGVLEWEDRAVRYVGLLALASIPAGLAGVLGRDFFVAAFGEPTAAAALLLVTGGLVWTLKWTSDAARDRRPDLGQALVVGVVQAFAIFPGVSRSGSTVAAGVWRGVDPVRMAEFSFLLSVPAIGGAALLELDGLGSAAASGGAPALTVGFLTALAAGVAAIRLFVRSLEARGFHHFAWYCWAAGGAYLVAAWLEPALR